MRSQVDRDEQTIMIATTLVLFALVSLLGVAVFLLLERVAEPSTGLQRMFFLGTFAAAASVSLRHLRRHRRPC